MIMDLHKVPIRVMHVIDSLSAGGAERMLVELVNLTNNENIAPHVCVTRSGLSIKNQIHAKIPVFCLDRKKTFELSKIFEFRNLIKKNNIQIIHNHGYSSFRFSFTARTLLRTPGKIILHAHSSAKPDLLTSIMGKLGIDCFVGVSETTCEWARLKFRLPEKKIKLIHNAIDPEPYKKIPPNELIMNYKKGVKKIGIVVANIRPEKDLLTLIRAVSISNFKNEMKILIVGAIADKDYYQSCIVEIKKLQVEEQIQFLGKRNDIPGLLRSVDFGLLSSKRETGPIALIEYLAARIPFVVTQVGQISQEVKKAGIPDCVPVGDIQAFADAIDRIFTIPQKEMDMRIDKGEVILRELFDIQNFSNTWNEVYSSLIN